MGSAIPRPCSSNCRTKRSITSPAVGRGLSHRGTLRITSLHDADTPLVHEGMVPLFTLDVWEHAYYIDYRNERPKFASNVLANIVNWDFVGENLDGRGEERANQEGAKTGELTA